MRRSYTAFFVFTVWIVTAIATAYAQSVRWEPDGGTLAYNQSSELQLVFENCEPQGQPSVPDVPGLTLRRAGTSSQTSIINGSITRTEAITYIARATQHSAVTIPSFAVDTDKGQLTVPAARFDVGDATVGQSSVPLDNVASSRFDAPAEVWAGEVFPLAYTLNIGRRYYHSLGSNFPDWNPTPLSVDDWSKPELLEASQNGEARVLVTYKTRASLKTPGSISLNSANQLVNITTGSSGFGFFPRPNLEQYSITSNRPNITVKALPANAPDSFGGAVGQFTLTSKVVPTSAAVGEPITWTLSLAGSGNWPDIAGLPAREVSKNFHVVQPQAKRTPKQGTVFDATLTEDVVLVPTEPGRYTIGPLTWTYFDPAKGAYQTITTEKTIVTVTPAAAQPSTPAPKASAQPATPNDTPPAPTAALEAIPGDPLPTASPAHAPLSRPALLTGLIAPLVGLVAFWLWLALRRARATDPQRLRREARTRISTTLSALRTARDRENIAVLLQAWQRDVAILWELPRAVPTPYNFPAHEKSWSQLWTEAERALYGDHVALPADWISRADAALASVSIRSFSPLQLFRPHNLFPFAAILFVAIFVSAASSQAADGRAAYARGDFPVAEQVWRDALAKTPTDWTAHYNLSLALAQQDRWGEAAAHASAAFAQQPGNAVVRQNLTFAIERAGFAPSAFTGFAREHPPHLVARLASATCWQWTLIAAVSLAALGAGVLLVRAYGATGSWLKPSAFTLIGAGVVLTLVSIFSLRVYSPVDDARAAIVWRATTLRSIPTEADTTQKTSALAAGTVALVDKTFLGWNRLAFSNGQTGWVRQEDLVRLWR